MYSIYYNGSLDWAHVSLPPPIRRLDQFSRFAGLTAVSTLPIDICNYVLQLPASSTAYSAAGDAD